MSSVLKRTGPVGLTTLVGIIMLVEYFLNVPYVGSVGVLSRNFGIVLAAFAMGVGAVNLLMVHWQHIKKRTPGQWYFSVWLIVVLFTFLGIGAIYTVNAKVYVWLFEQLVIPVNNTMYSLLAFFIASAAFRAFRLKTKEGAVMLVAGVLVMLGSLPAVVSIYGGMYFLRSWIMDVPTMAGLRGIIIGGSIGTIVMGLRTLIGVERGHLGGE